MKASFLLAAFVCSISLLLPGCITSRMERDLAENAAVQKEEFESLLKRASTEPASGISWQAAYRRMKDGNLSLRQSQQQLVEAGKQTRRQWYSLVPRLTAFVNLGSSISSLTNLSSDDVNARLIATLNIPNPFEFYASLYGAALQKQNAEWSHELDKRRAYAQLYSAFVDARSLNEAEASFEKRKQSLAGADTTDIRKLLKNLNSEAIGLERQRYYHRLSVNQLLNTPGSDWRLSGKLPVISYRDRYKRIKIGEDFGKLALNLQAIQIEGAMLRLERVKFQQWPSINFGFSNPPIYSSNDGSGFSSDDLQLFSGANKTVDLTDIGGRENIRDAETRLKYTREQIRQRMEAEVSRVLLLSRSYDQLLREEKQLQRELSRLEQPDSDEPEIVLKDLELRAQLELQLIETRRRVQQLDLQFLIWDETFWRS